MMQQTNLKNDNVLAAEWDKATNLQVHKRTVIHKLMVRIIPGVYIYACLFSKGTRYYCDRSK